MRMSVRILTALLIVPLLAPGMAAAQRDDPEYRIRYSPDDHALYVRACFPPGPGFSLRAESGDATDFLLFARDGDDRRVRLGRNRMFLPGSEDVRCIRYGVDLEEITADRGMRTGYRSGDSWITWSGTWFWRPRSEHAGTILQFDHPNGIGISAPWPLLQRSAEFTRYRIDKTPSDWSNLVAMGPFQPLPLATPGGELRVAIIPADPPMDESKMRRWMHATVDAVGRIYGHMPLASPQVLIAPIGRGNGPVPWAQVQRGGGTAVHLFVRQEHDLETFIEDWTASHEFSHMFHPYLGGSGRWWSEGLASYYQNVSRARAGQISERSAWQKLNAGFHRGIADTDHMTLRQANRRIREGKYMRVYWTGAAMALMADVELRRTTGGEKSLDSVLAEFAACHLPAQRMWRVEEMLSALDRLAGQSIFMDLYRRYADNSRFPDFEQAYAHLGLSLRRGRVQLNDDDPDALALRGQLMGQSDGDVRVASCPSRAPAVG